MRQGAPAQLLLPGAWSRPRPITQKKDVSVHEISRNGDAKRLTLRAYVTGDDLQ